MSNPIRFLVAALSLCSLAPAARAEDWYVARTGANNIYAAILGNSCGTFTGFVRTGTFPGALALNPAGSRVYVANFASAPTTGGDSVTVIDTASATPIKTITGISSPQDVAASSSRVYVASASRVVIIDTISNTVIGSVTLPGTVRRLAFNAATNRVFATASSSLFVINAADNSVVTSIAIAGDAGDVAVTPNGRRAFIGRDTPGPVAVVDLDTSAVVDRSRSKAYPSRLPSTATARARSSRAIPTPAACRGSGACRSSMWPRAASWPPSIPVSAHSTSRWVAIGSWSATAELAPTPAA